MLGGQIEYSLLELLGPPAILPQPIGSQIFSCYVAREMPYLFRVSRLRRLYILLRGTQVIVHRHVHRLNCLYLSFKDLKGHISEIRKFVGTKV